MGQKGRQTLLWLQAPLLGSSRLGLGRRRTHDRRQCA